MVEGAGDLGITDSTPRVRRFFDHPPPLVFAHRGGSQLGPENTLLAFSTGLTAGADGLELDVRLSRDGEVVVHHDSDVARTTNATGPVSAYTSDELAGLDAAYHFAAERGYPHRGRGIGVPRLREVLIRHPDVPVIIELKDDGVALAGAVAQVVRESGAEGRVCLAGFGPVTVEAARKGLPNAQSSAHHREVRWALYRSWCRVPVRRVAYHGYQVPESASGHRVVSPRFIRDAHRAGLRVQVWTVDQEADMRRLLAWGVDALISDRPDVARRVVDEWGRISVAGSAGLPPQ